MNRYQMLVRLFGHMEEVGNFHFAVTRKENKEFLTLYEFGREAPGSPMYGGASYGVGTLDECLHQHMEDLRLNVEPFPT